MNEVYEVTIGGRGFIARLGSRAAADLDWEIALLERLRSAGLAVPRLVPTVEGEFRVGGLVVMERVDGELPTSKDWHLVAAYLHRLHDVASGSLAQRPGWCSCTELVAETVSGPVDLTVLPADVLARCRLAWARLSEWPRRIIHGDPNPHNIRIGDNGVVLLDWDEARVDVPQLDLSALPPDASGLGDDERLAAEQAAHAWEAAMFWTTAPDYARRRFAKLS